MKIHIRIISLCLVLCLLSACGIGETEPTERPGRYVYSAERTEFGDVHITGNAVMLSGRIYFIGEDGTGEPGIYSVSASGGAPQRLERYEPVSLPEGSEGRTRPLCLAVTMGGKLAVAEERVCSTKYGAEGALYASSSDLELYPYEVYRQDEYVRILNADGSEASRMLVNRNARGGWSYFTVSSFAIDAQGRVYIDADDQLLVRDASGELRWLHFERELASVEELYLAGDGHVYVFGRGYDGQGRFYYVNPEGKRGPELRLIGTSDGAGDFCGAVGGFVSAYIDGAMLYGWEPASGITAEMLDLVSVGVEPKSLSSVFETESGYVCLGSEEPGTGGTASYMTVVSRAHESEAPQRTELVYACCGADELTLRLIAEFNRSESEYLIRIRDYSEYNSPEDPEAGYRRLESDILAGRAGDILDCSGVSTAAAEARGLLTELGALLYADDELKSALVKPVLSALEMDGGLYTIPSGFGVVTALGPARFFGEGAELSYSAALTALGGVSAGCELFDFGTTGPEVLSLLLEADPDRFIDWESGACSFEAEDFIALLEFAGSFPAVSEASEEERLEENNQPYARIASGRQLLMCGVFTSPNMVQGSTELFSGASVTGLPGYEGGFTSVKLEGPVYAISSGCEDAPAAWRLLRSLIRAQALSSGLPVLMERLDADISSQMAEGMSEQDATLLYMAIDDISACARTLPSGLMELIDAAAAPYFAGEASVQECAAEINKQVSAFFSEMG